MAYIFLAVAIVCEVFGSAMLKMSVGFTKLVPTIGVVIGYGAAFYFLSNALKFLPISITYAIWAGVGTALTAIIGLVFWKESFTLQSFLGLMTIIIGVVILNMPSKI